MVFSTLPYLLCNGFTSLVDAHLLGESNWALVLLRDLLRLSDRELQKAGQYLMIFVTPCEGTLTLRFNDMVPCVPGLWELVCQGSWTK